MLKCSKLLDITSVFASAQIEKVPQSYVQMTDPYLIMKFEKMLEKMENNDDIQNVWHNREE